MGQLTIKKIKGKVLAMRATVVSIKDLTIIKQVLVKDMISKKVAQKVKRHQLNPTSVSRLN